MLTITVPGAKFYDDEASEFIELAPVDLQLEHSLVSLSKWESFYKKRFLSDDEKTAEELLQYVKLMTLTEVPEETFSRLSQENIAAINEYMNDEQTATWFKETPGQGRSREIITAEVVYYWMIQFNIPVEFENWHLNRLFTLIRVCNEKQKPAKKRNQQEVAQDWARINAERRAKMGTNG